jgi:hypothetical protein
MTPNFPGDVIIFAGEIVAIAAGTSEVSVEVAFSGRNGQGYHTSGTASLALPNINTTL